MTGFKSRWGSCSFNCCDEDGISPGSPYIQMRPAEIPFSVQLLKDTGALSSFSDGHPIHAAPGEIPSSSQQLKLQVSCPLLNLVTLVELLQL